MSANGTETPAEGPQGGAQDWPQSDDLHLGGDTATPGQNSDSATAEDEVREWTRLTNPKLDPGVQDDSGVGVAGQNGRRKSTPGLVVTNEYGEQVNDSTEDKRDKWSKSPEGSGSEYETAEEWGDGGRLGDWAGADDELSEEGAGQLQQTDCVSESSRQEEKMGGVFNSTGGVSYSEPFAKTEFGNQGDAFEIDPFAEMSGEGGAAGWDTDPFANSFLAPSSASNTEFWLEVTDSSHLETSVTRQNCETTGEGSKDVNIPRIHKEPENSDMSEDEAANRRFGKLYQELDTEKEEVLDFLP